MVDHNDYCTISEAAQILHLSIGRVYHLTKYLPHIKCGSSRQSRVLFRRSQLIEAYKNI